MLGAKDNQTFFGQKRVCPPSTRGLLRMFAADANVGEHVMIDRPNVRCEKYHVILHVADVGSAVEFYTQKLGFWLAFTENMGGYQWFENYVTNLEAVTLDEVKEAAVKYLRPQNRTVGYFIPTADEGDGDEAYMEDEE